VRRALVLALLLAACDDGTPAHRVCTVSGTPPDSTSSIGCSNDYEVLGFEETPFATFAHTNTINVLIDREDDGRVYYLNSSRWWLHFDFVYFVLEGHPESERGTAPYNQAHAQFNILNYQSATRHYVLGKVVQYRDQKKLVFEMAAGDEANADLIAWSYERAASGLYDADDLLYRPVSGSQEQLVPELEGRVPLISSAELFAGQTYQPLNPGTSWGYLRFRKASQLEGDPVLPVDIVVLDRVPNDITVVSGIVTAEFQTPLSHINILAKNRGTPNMALRHGFTDPALRALEGELIKLTVGPKEFVVEPGDLAEAQAWWDSIRPPGTLTPEYDLSVTGVVDLVNAGATPSAAITRRHIGAKAANFAEMMRIAVPRPVRLPLPAAALPFSAFEQHMTENGLWPQLEAIVADVAAGTLSQEDLSARLFQLRWAVYQAPMNGGLLAILTAYVTATWGTADLRFRSSTNVEDLEDFSGAGLYTSVSGSTAVAAGPGSLESAVKVVWASTFNAPAFVEREFYRVDHREVRMGILIHPAFGEELANGVAITLNEFTPLRPGFYINSQIGEVSVTNPTGEAIPEQILWYTWYDHPEYEVLSRSSLTGGSPVLDDAQYGELAEQLNLLHLRFRPIFCQIPGTDPVQLYPECGVDVEWKLATDGQIYVKQARPVRGAPE
jgi:hypothetical protein